MLDPIEEEKFADLRNKCRELRVPAPPELKIELQVRDECGNLIFDDIQRAHSWNRNFYNILFGALTQNPTLPTTGVHGAGSLAGRNTAGTSQVGYAAYDNGFSAGTLGSSANGIVLGTGSTACSLLDYALAAQIIHGTTSGTLVYMAEPVTSVFYNAAIKTWEGLHTRNFINNSGTEIVAREIGFIQNNASIMLERSLLIPEMRIPNFATATATYNFSMDFSMID
jgi:hypothetical protein